MSQPLSAVPTRALAGTIRVPGDKSISHRALILGALATGRTRITGLLESEDVLATARAVVALGAQIRHVNGSVEVTGQGVGGLQAPIDDLDFGNSGTGSRLMLGVVAGHDMEARFTGDASLCRRPMARARRGQMSAPPAVWSAVLEAKGARSWAAPRWPWKGF